MLHKTSVMKVKVERILNDAKCRFCKEKDNMIDHIISECNKITQSDYKNCHNKAAVVLLSKAFEKYLASTGKISDNCSEPEY